MRIHIIQRIITGGEVMGDIIEVLDIEDMPDGSAMMTMDIEPEHIRSFVHTGLRHIISQMEVDDVSPNTFEESTRTLELTDEELNVLFHFGVITALKRGMEHEQIKEAEEDGG